MRLILFLLLDVIFILAKSILRRIIIVKIILNRPIKLITLKTLIDIILLRLRI